MSGADAEPGARRWLAERSEGVPRELTEEVGALLEAARAGPPARFVAAGPEGDGQPGEGERIGRRLARAALCGLEQAARDAEERAAALRLLAADAALTYAFEAAAELGADAGRLATEVGLEGAIGHALEKLAAE